MSRWVQVAVVALASVLLASQADQAVVRWLGIGTGGVGHKVLGATNGPERALAEGSSLMCDAISWQQVADLTGTTIDNWFVAGSSPSEWEMLQSRAAGVHLTFITVSAYDLNEDFPCDYRANLVPFLRTIRDLRQSRSDLPFSKRLLSQYALKYVRIPFPTVGRSDGVMVGLREKIVRWMAPWIKIQEEAGPAVEITERPGTENDKTEKLTEWSPARTLRRLALMRSACGGRHRFDGPKKLALLRMLNQAQRQGEVVVVVLPVSETYRREFLSPEADAQFESTLSMVQQSIPAARWFRLDRLDELKSDNFFCDLVHMNAYGQRIATPAFVSQLAQDRKR